MPFLEDFRTFDAFSCPFLLQEKKKCLTLHKIIKIKLLFFTKK